MNYIRTNKNYGICVIMVGPPKVKVLFILDDWTDITLRFLIEIKRIINILIL